MKIFISWSGNRSRVVAELIRDWVKCVLQASKPWISSRDIDRGAIWFSEISDQLKDTSVGIVCLTDENKNRPWILFETGALAKGLSSNRVCTFLVDIQPADLQDPLAQFNHTTPTKLSMLSLVRSLNSCLDNIALDEKTLDQVFNIYWPEFESGFADALESNLPSSPAIPRSDNELLGEILSNTRGLTARMREIEAKVETKNSSSQINALQTSHSFDKKAINSIRTMLSHGSSDFEIINSLVDYDMPESYVIALIAKTRLDMQ